MRALVVCTSLLVWLLLSVSVGPPRANALCAVSGPFFELLHDEITSGGALVLGRGARPHPGVPSLEGLAIRAGGAVVPSRLEEIAPGLQRVVPATPLPEGRGELHSASGRANFVVVEGPPARLAPPAVRSTRIVVSSGGRWHTTAVWARLRRPPPEHAIAVIVHDATGPRSWLRIGDDDSTELLIARRDRCGGSMPPAEGDTIRIAWLSVDGSTSSLSAATVVSSR